MFSPEDGRRLRGRSVSAGGVGPLQTGALKQPQRLLAAICLPENDRNLSNDPTAEVSSAHVSCITQSYVLMGWKEQAGTQGQGGKARGKGEEAGESGHKKLREELHAKPRRSDLGTFIMDSVRQTCLCGKEVSMPRDVIKTMHMRLKFLLRWRGLAKEIYIPREPQLPTTL